MAMYPPSNQSGFTPSSEQLERERQLQRFNRLYIYVPVGVFTAFGIFLFVLMLVGIFAPGLTGAEEFLSGLADTILVLWMIPMMVLFAVTPIAYVAYLVNRRQRRSMLPPDSPLLRHSRAQMALWKAQNIAGSLEETTDSAADKITQPLINANSKAAYTFAWLDMLTRPFRRDDNDPDGIG